MKKLNRSVSFMVFGFGETESDDDVYNNYPIDLAYHFKFNDLRTRCLIANRARALDLDIRWKIAHFYGMFSSISIFIAFVILFTQMVSKVHCRTRRICRILFFFFYFSSENQIWLYLMCVECLFVVYPRSSRTQFWNVNALENVNTPFCCYFMHKTKICMKQTVATIVFECLNCIVLQCS